MSDEIGMPEAIFTARDLAFSEDLARSHPLAPEMDVARVAELALPILRLARELFAEGVEDIPRAVYDVACGDLPRGPDDVRITIHLGHAMTDLQCAVALDMVRLAVARWRAAAAN